MDDLHKPRRSVKKQYIKKTKRTPEPSNATEVEDKKQKNTTKKKDNSTSQPQSSFANKRKVLKEYVNGIKKAGKCVKCGESDIACLDFHHVSGKNDNVSDMVRRAVPLRVLKAEIDNCILVCANCHRKIHFYGSLNTASNKVTKKTAKKKNKQK
jgi:hypothetical protein